MKFSLVAQQALAVPACAAFTYIFLVRPWRRERRLTLDGTLVLGCWLMYWQDPLVNYSANFEAYNAGFFNRGSWLSKVPGVLAPEAHRFAEPLLWAPLMYPVALFGMTIVANAVMRKAKARWPSLGKLGLIAICVGFIALVDLILEVTWMRTGVFAYGGAIRWLTLFPGHYYQWPVYETLWGATWAGFACLRYFRNDKGETFAERGLDRLRVGGRARPVIRVLAIAGAMNAMFICYGIALSFFAQRQDPWPQDILSRSYLTNNLCGPGTSYHCPGPGIPIPRPNSAHISPEGTLVVPAGTTVATESR